MSKNEAQSDKFTNPLLRAWCHKDAPPKDWQPVDRLGELWKYYGYFEVVE